MERLEEITKNIKTWSMKSVDEKLRTSERKISDHLFHRLPEILNVASVIG